MAAIHTQAVFLVRMKPQSGNAILRQHWSATRRHGREAKREWAKAEGLASQESRDALLKVRQALASSSGLPATSSA